jgi:hypothetical protein
MTEIDGNFIYQWRVKHGMTQAQAAAVLGVAHGTLRNWEQGVRNPPGHYRLLIDRLRASDYPKKRGSMGKRPIGVTKHERRKAPKS